jgi:hypothetical protein
MIPLLIWFAALLERAAEPDAVNISSTVALSVKPNEE